MAAIGIHASHEQIPPSALLTAMRDAEAAGFERAWSSDHFSPWSARQGESGFAWSWLGAAMQATAMPYGVVNAPGQRYHPAIVAQAAATLAELFPGRFSVALGSGEFSNERITGEVWPRKAVRNARLRECANVIRALLAGEAVDHDGLVRVEGAKLWTLPAEPPPLLGAAVTVETAGFVGEWADGLITINQPHEQLERLLAAFRERGGEGKPVAVQVHLSWAETEQEALRIAHDQWRTNIFPPPVPWDTATVEAFDAIGEKVRPEDMHGPVLVSADLARHAAWIRELADLGFDAIYLHHVGREQRRFIEAFGEHVLPAL
jgi:probable non-F420 flavinoid oxidoreductase